MKKKNYVEMLAETRVLKRTELTQEEYRDELKQFQEMICKIIFDETGDEVTRLDDAIVCLNRVARNKGLESDQRFRRGAEALRRANKEVAISMSGWVGEERVNYRLNCVSNPVYKFNNVYIAHDELETELDNVILTKAGFMILEVKNTKSDITISEDGRLMYDDERHNDKSICEKMDRKRQLLRKELARKMEEAGIDLPIRIESYIVFSTPRDKRIRVTDLCHQERFCFTGSLPYKVDAFATDAMYSDDEYEVLNKIMCELATKQKKFKLKLDFNGIKADIGAALQLCFAERETRKPELSKRTYRRFVRPLLGSAASLAIGIAGTLVSGLVLKRI